MCPVCSGVRLTVFIKRKKKQQQKTMPELLRCFERDVSKHLRVIAHKYAQRGFF